MGIDTEKTKYMAASLPKCRTESLLTDY